MRVRRTVAVLIAVTVLIGAIFVWQLMTFPIFGPCASELVGRFPSSGRGEVIVYVTNCGATTPFVTSAAYGSKNAPFDPATADDIFRVRDRVNIEVLWPEGILDETTRFEIVYPKGSEILRQAIRWNGVVINYTER